MVDSNFLPQWQNHRLHQKFLFEQLRKKTLKAKKETENTIDFEHFKSLTHFKSLSLVNLKLQLKHQSKLHFKKIHLFNRKQALESFINNQLFFISLFFLRLFQLLSLWHILNQILQQVFLWKKNLELQTLFILFMLRSRFILRLRSKLNGLKDLLNRRKRNKRCSTTVMNKEEETKNQKIDETPKQMHKAKIPMGMELLAKKRKSLNGTEICWLKNSVDRRYYAFNESFNFARKACRVAR